MKQTALPSGVQDITGATYASSGTDVKAAVSFPARLTTWTDGTAFGSPAFG